MSPLFLKIVFNKEFIASDHSKTLEESLTLLQEFSKVSLFLISINRGSLLPGVTETATDFFFLLNECNVEGSLLNEFIKRAA